jgi:hypothetical protein
MYAFIRALKALLRRRRERGQRPANINLQIPAAETAHTRGKEGGSALELGETTGQHLVWFPYEVSFELWFVEPRVSANNMMRLTGPP